MKCVSESAGLRETPKTKCSFNLGIFQTGYLNIFEYLLTNIFIRSNIRGFSQSKYIWTFIRDFFLLMNIFGHALGILDSNKYIVLKPLNKIKFFIKKKHRQNNISAINV